MSPSALGGGPLQQRLHVLLPADVRLGRTQKRGLEICHHAVLNARRLYILEGEDAGQLVATLLGGNRDALALASFSLGPDPLRPSSPFLFSSLFSSSLLFLNLMLRLGF